MTYTQGECSYIRAEEEEENDKEEVVKEEEEEEDEADEEEVEEIQRRWSAAFSISSLPGYTP